MAARRFDRIAVRLDWLGVEVADVDRFCDACGFPILENTRIEQRFFDRQMTLALPFEFLGPQRRAKFNRLCIRWQAREAIISGGPSR